MAEPKKQLTRTRRGNRRSHDAIKIKVLSVCGQCLVSKPQHKVCPNCGYYRGQKIDLKV